MKKKQVEIGIPKSASASVKRMDDKFDKKHGVKEGSVRDLKVDKAIMKSAQKRKK